MPRTYPIELKLQGRRVVVVGGGKVAARKAVGLVEAGADLLVVSPDLCPELERIAGPELKRAAYTSSVLDTAELVLACTDDPEVNARVAADACTRGILCNVADDPDLGDFFLPAVVRRGDFTVAIATGGGAPHLAARARDLVASQFGDEYGILVDEVGRLRRDVQHRVTNPADRRAVHLKLSSEESLHLLAQGGRDRWRAWAEEVIAQAAKSGAGE